jgi:hypothetical protein
MRRSLFGSALLCSLAAAILLSACGSGGSSSSTSSSVASAAATKAAKAATAARRAAEAKAPKGASPTLRAIYANFPAPKPNPEVKRSTAAIRAGIAACKGKTPVRVKEEFYAAARRHLSPEQAKLIARIDTYEKHSSADASFASGQLAAGVYEATLPAGIGQYGYEGCVYSLVQGLERRLAPR